MHGAKGAEKLRKRISKILHSIKPPEDEGGGDVGSWPLSAQSTAKRPRLA